jgi:hypothetical protein
LKHSNIRQIWEIKGVVTMRKSSLSKIVKIQIQLRNRSIWPSKSNIRVSNMTIQPKRSFINPNTAIISLNNLELKLFHHKKKIKLIWLTRIQIFLRNRMKANHCSWIQRLAAQQVLITSSWGIISSLIIIWFKDHS